MKIIKTKLTGLTIMVSLTLLISQSLFAQKYSDRNDILNSKKFEATQASLETYQCPKWFRDAKFGIWADWGPQSVPHMGDWFARKMYIENVYNENTHKYTGKPDEDYVYAIKHYGPQSQFGYKDIIKMWKAQDFHPNQLMKLYKAAGAKYFVSIGSHHDNFFLWNSKIHRWNSVNMGPHRDIVGDWQAAAKKEGLKFGVSEHLGASYTWYQPAHNADSKGKYKGIPYDANDPEYADLYHSKAADRDDQWLTNNKEWQYDWLAKINELVNMYHPDLLYSDSAFPFEEVGCQMVSHFYNTKLDKKGRTNVVYNCKEDSRGRFVRDLECGIASSISKYPWQTDTSIGNWFYKDGDHYKSSTQILQMLVDIVSKNGNLLLNIVQTPEGIVEDCNIKTLREIGTWMDQNGKAIYGSRPWDVYGEGPATVQEQEHGFHDGIKDVRPYTSQDIRYTMKDGKLFAFVMEHPNDDITIKALTHKNQAADFTSKTGSIVRSVRLLSTGDKLEFSQKEDGTLTIKKPSSLPSYAITVYEIRFKKN